MRIHYVMKDFFKDQKINFYLLPITVFLLFLLGLEACNSSEFEPNDQNGIDIEYYPLSEGKYRIYQYDTLIYKGANRETLSGYKKYEIGESFLDESGTLK